jgi:hypothetical protein
MAKLGSDWMWIGVGAAALYVAYKLTKPTVELADSASNLGSSILDSGSGLFIADPGSQGYTAGYSAGSNAYKFIYNTNPIVKGNVEAAAAIGGAAVGVYDQTQKLFKSAGSSNISPVITVAKDGSINDRGIPTNMIGTQSKLISSLPAPSLGNLMKMVNGVTPGSAPTKTPAQKLIGSLGSRSYFNS